MYIAHTHTHTHRPDTVDLLSVLVTPGVQDGNKASLKNVRTLSVTVVGACAVFMFICTFFLRIHTRSYMHIHIAII